MATREELLRDQELPQRLGLPPVRVWPPKADWYTADGELRRNLPRDPYSRGMYPARGMRPDLWRNRSNHHHANDSTPSTPRLSITLADALVALGNWAGTSTDLHSRLEMLTPDIPASASRLSREITNIENQLKVHGISVQRVRDRHSRRIQLLSNQPVTAVPMTAESTPQ